MVFRLKTMLKTKHIKYINSSFFFKEPGRKIYGVTLPSENDLEEDDDDVNKYSFNNFYLNLTL